MKRVFTRRWLWGGVQIFVTVIVALIVGRTLARNWGAFRSLRIALTLQPGWIGLAALAVFAAYALQIEAWRRILAGWAQPVSYGRAARILLCVNIARYVPGKVWSVAGLVGLARRDGVAAWAALASAFASQAISVGTAVVVAAVTIPAATSPLRLATAALMAVAIVALLAWRRGAGCVAALTDRLEGFGVLPLAAVATSSALVLTSWLAYGIAFWLLAPGLGLPAGVPLSTATGVFALGCLLGVLALFAPAGVGVRDLTLIALLTPALGSGGAVAVSVSSRVLLTICEVVAALGCCWQQDVLWQPEVQAPRRLQ